MRRREENQCRFRKKPSEKCNEVIQEKRFFQRRKDWAMFSKSAHGYKRGCLGQRRRAWCRNFSSGAIKRQITVGGEMNQKWEIGTSKKQGLKVIELKWVRHELSVGSWNSNTPEYFWLGSLLDSAVLVMSPVSNFCPVLSSSSELAHLPEIGTWTAGAPAHGSFSFLPNGKENSRTFPSKTHWLQLAWSGSQVHLRIHHSAWVLFKVSDFFNMPK